MQMNAIVRERLEAQGFTGLDNASLAAVAPWLRWSPVICTVFMAAGLALQSPFILWLLAATAFLGALLPFHPFDLLFNFGFRHLLGLPPFPLQGPQRRFACAMATVWLIATGWAFYADWSIFAFALGVPLVLVAGLVSITHICIPSIIYNWLRSRKTAL